MSSPLEKLRLALARKGTTQLGIGPMSRRCVDAGVDLANTLRIPLMLIASRRQIECQALGGGYANNWTTEAFAEYVRQRDHGNFISLCRDHGGPYQGEGESGLSSEAALHRAQLSFNADIDAGFHILHLDTSFLPDPTLAFRNLLDLYADCYSYAASRGRAIAFEVGTEEQSGSAQDLAWLNALLRKLQTFCQSRELPPPLFAVGQTGTLVKEMENVGAVTSPFRVNGQLPVELLIPKVVSTCHRNSVYLKQHNTDYLNDKLLAWHPRIGIDASNVAPEIGVRETQALLELCQRCQRADLEQRLLQIAFDSGKWTKWLKEDSQASERDKAVMCAHYVLSQPDADALLAELSHSASKHGIDFDRFIKGRIQESIRRYLKAYALAR